MKQRLVYGLLASLFLLLVGLGVRDPGPAFPSPRLCLEVLDVGQGDAQLVELPGRRFWLVDGGGRPGGDGKVGDYAVLPALRRRGVERLDRLLISHGDADHFEGLFAVVEAIPIDEVWVPTRHRSGPRFRRLLRRAEALGASLRVVDEGSVFGAAPAPVRAEILHPWPGWRDGESREATGRNNGSLVLRLALGRVSFLLAGDIEAPAELRLLEAGLLSRTTVLKVPHHGSRSSSHPRFVEAVDPLVALAGLGRDNRFGFPHASVRARYLFRGTRLYWTARHGSLRLCTDGWELQAYGRQRRGGAVLLSRWGPEAIAEASSRSPREEEVPEARSPDSRRRCVGGRSFTRNPGRPSRAGPTRSGKKGAVSRGSRRAVSEDKAPVSPKLLEERVWERRRKKRSRLKPAW